MHVLGVLQLLGVFEVFEVLGVLEVWGVLEVLEVLRVLNVLGSFGASPPPALLGENRGGSTGIFIPTGLERNGGRLSENENTTTIR